MPAYGIIASTTLASIAMIINYLGSNGATVFTTLVLMTGITAAIPYAFSALAQIKWRLADHRAVETPRFVRDMVVAVVSLVLLGAVHLVLAQHRAQLLGLLGAVPARRRRTPARDPGVRVPAGQDDRARTGPGVPVAAAAHHNIRGGSHGHYADPASII